MVDDHYPYEKWLFHWGVYPIVRHTHIDQVPPTSYNLVETKPDYSQVSSMSPNQVASQLSQGAPPRILQRL